MKYLRILVLWLLPLIAHAANAPITNAQLSGSANQVNSGATFTIKSGASIIAEDGATVTGFGGGGGGSGTVTSIPNGSTNGVTWTVANRTTTPTFTFSLGAITPTTINASGAGVFSGLTAFSAAGPYVYSQSNNTTGTPTFSAINSGSATLSLVLNGSGIAGTTFGLSNANLGLLLANAAGGTYPSAIAIGTSNNTPVVFGVNGSEVGRFTSTGLNGMAIGSTTPSTGAFTTLSSSSGISVASGGTGVQSLTANNVILGAGTSAVTFVAPGSSGNILTSNGTTWTSAAAPSGTIPSQTGHSGEFLTSNGTTASWVAATGTGTVTSVSVTTANGVSGSVATSTSTPAITLTLGAINPTSIGATTPGSGAFTTLTASTPMAGASGGTGVSNSGKTITLGGNLTTSGAFATTLTVTAGTNVTLPTTGTLATLAGTEALSNKTLTASAFNGTIGATTPSTGEFTQVLINSTTPANYGFNLSGTVNSSAGGAGVAAGFISSPTLTATANSQSLRFMNAGNGTFATATFTGLNGYGILLQNPAISGSGTIANHYGIYLEAPTRGTTNYGLYVAGGLNFFGDNTALAASKYLNWGTTYGTSGYGIRDNAGTMQVKNSGGGWANIGSGAGTGDVVGPASAVDNNVVVYDGTSGKLIKDSGAVLLTVTGTPAANQVVEWTGPSTVQAVATNGTGNYVRATGATIDLSNGTGLPTRTVAQGGTGATTLTANNVLLGNGTSAVQVVAPSTSGNILTSNGTTWTSAAPPTGTLPSQTGNAGKVLGTDGTSTSWVTGGGGTGDANSVLTSAATSVSTGTTLSGSDFGKSFTCVDSGSPADYTLTLPDPTSHTGQHVEVVIGDAMTKLVTVDAGSGKTINGQRTRVMHAGEVARLRAINSTTWNKVGGNSIPFVCRISKSGSVGVAGQSISNATFTKITHDTADYDNGSMADTTNSTITIRRPSRYRMIACTTYYGVGGGAARCLGRIFKNTTTELPGTEINLSANSYSGPITPLTTALTTGDVLHHSTYQNNGGGLNLYGDFSCNFTVEEILSW